MEHALVSKIGRGNGSKNLPLLTRLSRGPIVDKFMVLSGGFGTIGTLYFGTLLWLEKTGALSISQNYMAMKQSHSFIQIFFLFGFIITGFLIQSGPRLFSLSSPGTTFLNYPILILQCLSGLSFLFAPLSICSLSLSSVSFSLAIISILNVAKKSDTFSAQTFFFTSSLLTLAIGPWLDVNNPVIGLCVVWGAGGMAILGASQIFIANLLGGRRLYPGENFVLYFFALATMVCWALGAVTHKESYVSFGGFLLCTTIIFFFIKTKLYKIVSSIRYNPIGIAALFGAVWVVLASRSLILFPYKADSAIHMIALGWGLPIIIAVSSHILGFLSGKRAISSRTLSSLLIIWQLTPLQRGGVIEVDSPPGSITVAIATSVVLGIWVYTILFSEYRILMRQFQLSGDERMVTEA